MNKTQSISGTRHLPVFIACLLLTACNAGNGTSEVLQTEELPIGFSTAPAETRQTRNDGLTADNLSAIGVYAYYTGSRNMQKTDTPNFMCNQKVTRTEGSSTWTYSPLKYWPNNPADKLSFFAYGPYNTGSFSVSGSAQSGPPVIEYTPPRSESAQTDLLAAVPLMNQTSASDNSLVKFRFHHTLTRIAIYVKSDDNTTGKQITAFSIRGMKNGILTCHIPENSKDKGFGWSYPAPAETETFTATATRFDIPDNTAAPKELLATFYLLPYGTESVFNLTYTYQAYNSDNTDITQTIVLSNQTLPSTEMWTEGASISYTLGISRKKVTVTAGSLPTWNTGSTETVSETVVIN